MTKLSEHQQRTAFTPCPFCAGRYALCTDAILHSLPYCPMFRDNDVLVFARQARLATVGALPDDDLYPVDEPVKGRT